MSEHIRYRRLLDKTNTPTEQLVLKTIGAKRSEMWNDLREFLDIGYDFTAELDFHRKWMYKRVLNGSDLRDVKLLIALKKKPRA